MDRESRFVGTIKRRAGLLIGAALVIAVCIGIRSLAGPTPAGAIPPLIPNFKKSNEKTKGDAATKTADKKGAPQSGTPAEAPKLSYVAVVNNEQISRDELAKECLRHYGNEVLESMMNKHLIAEQCRRKGITITQQQVDEEIDRMARKFSLPKDQYVQMLEKERGIKPAQYANDIIWPTMALRQLAAKDLTVSPAELEQAFESQFGAAVRARLIAVTNPAEAEEIRRKAIANPDEFGALARKHSKDVNSASANGLIQPIRRHLGDKAVEDAAFALKPGEISPVVKVGNQFILLKCEGINPPSRPDRTHVDPLLVDAIKDRKLRGVANDLFKQMQEDAVVVNVMNDPKKSKEMPGIAAVINQKKITIRDLAEECMERHGAEVLDGAINRRLLEQALKKHGLAVSQQDIDAEIARAAISMGKVTESGKPDVKSWLQEATTRQGITMEVYINDSVWPSAALKKLAGNNIKIGENDLEKGFQANYGPRVKCRAIVVSNQRKAQEVWEMARQDLSVENFGRLAEKYSIEPASQALHGEVPPIQRHGGQPTLEAEAFKLKAGELSGIVQVGDTYVILLCEGFTRPVDVKFDEVKNLIYEDLHEKKLRVAMSKQFDQLKDNAAIDNLLAGTIKSPKKAGPVDKDIKIANPPAQTKRR